MTHQEIRPPRMQQTRPSARPRSSGLGVVLVLIALTVGGAALVKTLVKNKTHSLGRDQAAVERNIAALRQEIHAVELDIKAMLVPKHLKDRLMAERTLLFEFEGKEAITIPRLPEAEKATP